jgi:hypothetical protein
LQANWRWIIVGAAVWTANIAGAFLTTRYLFQMNRPAVFFGWDGQSFLALFAVRRRLSDAVFGLGSDFVMGLGNVFSDPNPRWFPSILLTWSPEGLVDGPVAYAIGATELFAATLAAGRLLGFRLGTSAAAAWLITLCTWPLFVAPKIVSLWFFTPTTAEVLCISAMIITCSILAAGWPMWRGVALSALILLGLSHLVLSYPTGLVLVGPAIAVSAGVSFLCAETRLHRISVVLCWTGIAIGCLALGYAQYVRGVLSFTATSVFPEMFKRPQTLYDGETTLLLWTPLSPLTMATLFTPERVFVGGGILGSIALALSGSSRQHRLAITVLFSECIFLALGFANYIGNFWFGPQVRYFELMLFPFFALSACYIAEFLLCSSWRFVTGRLAGLELRPHLSLAGAGIGVAAPIIFGIWALGVGPTIQEQSRRYVGYAIASAFPQPETSITRILKAEAGLSPGAPFRGRVATLLGRFPEARDNGIHDILHYFIQLATGNLHDGPGLWQDDIPTLLEYNRLMSPTRFAFSRYFLTDSKTGAWKVDLRMLRVLGVRFIITDFPLIELTLRQELQVPTPAAAHKLLLASSKPLFDHFELYLYELDHPNLGQFSPTEVRQASDASSILERLSSDSIDLDHLLIGTDSVKGPLAKATLQSFVVARNGYTVRAVSEGSSILLLPLEFSRCLHLVNRTSGAPPRLFRADLLLTAVQFERNLDAEIHFRSGPFTDPSCRMQDLRDVNYLQLRMILSAITDH